MTLSFLYRAFCRVLQLIRLICRSGTDLAVEVVMLRQEVAVMRRQVRRPALDPADRAVLVALARLLPRRHLGRFFVQPETLLRWHRDLVTKRWTYPQHQPGRPAIAKGTTALVLRLAKGNPTWGYRRIRGELVIMGIVIAASSVWAILKRHGIEPSPRRSGPTWAEFLAAQAKGLVACNFSHVDTVFLRRLYVLVFIPHDTRLVRIAGVTAKPVTEWVAQQARHLSMNLAEQASALKFLIRDRDTKFTGSLDAVVVADGIKILKSPVRAPRANAICERVIGTIRRECLDRMLILGCRHLEAVLAEYVEHYNVHRPPLPQPSCAIRTGLDSRAQHRLRSRQATKNRSSGRPHPRAPDRRLNWADGVLDTHRVTRGPSAKLHVSGSRHGGVARESKACGGGAFPVFEPWPVA